MSVEDFYYWLEHWVLPELVVPCIVDSFVEGVSLALHLLLALVDLQLMDVWLEVNDPTEDHGDILGQFNVWDQGVALSPRLHHVVEPVDGWDVELLCLVGEVKLNLCIH